jgi:hypothetical protein
MRLRTKLGLTVVVGALVITGAGIAPAGADGSLAATAGDEVTATDTAQALAATPGVMAASDSVVTTSDADSAATSTVDGTTVDVPRDASAGVDLSSGGVSVTITPPNAADSGTGQTVAPGVVAYPSDNGSATAVQATEGGGVRMLTVIDSAAAPTAYGYKIAIPDGGHVELAEGGGAIVIDGAGQTVLAVPAPWATDANQQPVPTHFVVAADGRSLTQVIEHGSSTAYPVTADPSFWGLLGNYLGCIFGVGVPIGVAIGIASLPATWPFVITWAYKQSANGDRAIISYVTRVYNVCRRYFRS